MKDCKNLWDATVAYEKMMSDFSVSLPISKLQGDIKWQNHVLSTSSIPARGYIGWTAYYVQYHAGQTPLFKSTKASHIGCHENIKLVLVKNT